MNSKIDAGTDFMPLDNARWRLTYLWFPAAGVPFLIMIIQSALGKFGTDIQAAWSWFLPNVMPTLTLILGVLASVAFEASGSREVRRPFFLLSYALSAVYLGVLTLTMFLQVFSSMKAVEFMSVSSFWLTPLQSLAAGAIGVLFTTQKTSAGKPDPEAAIQTKVDG